MEELVYVDRKNTNCNKWDGQTGMFGEEGLHAMWVADMDFRVPQGVVDALKEYVEQGVFGYYKMGKGAARIYGREEMDAIFTWCGCGISLVCADSVRAGGCSDRQYAGILSVPACSEK